ncbi:MAG: glutamine amidotransferase, partial [Clostridiales bacterium]|nr:glutamine amidotransferase [Clostridiales bacterium]
SEVYVENLSVPSVVRVGDKYNITVTVVSNVETDARLSLYAGRSLKGQQEIRLSIGTNQFVFEDVAKEESIAQYKAVIEADDDTISVNNTYVTYAEIEATARVLLVEGTTGNSDEFQKLLDAANIACDCVDPSAVPSAVAGLLNYKAVITVDVYYDDLKSGFVDALETYVSDYAGGYICIGGSNSYALGNYRDTVLEDILPVTVDPQGEEEIPKIAMAMVIDHSGSMSATSSENSSVTALTLAKQAAIAGASELRETDEVGVLAFDDSFDWVLPIQLADDQDAIESAISSIIVEGGTDIHNALVEAYEQISKSDASIKHIILLTDGEDGYMEYEELFGKINDAGVTLSTVAVGEASATSVLQWMAESCGGRYYYTDISTSIPRIFAQEVYLSTNTYLINGEFYPSVTSSNEILSGLYDEGMPAFLGYIATSAKGTADVLLTSENGDPLLAVWQYGLGRTVAWTSDGTNEWTAEYAMWENYPQLWANIINYVISDNSLGEDEIEITAGGGSATITYKSDDYDASTSVTAVVTDEDGEQQEITLEAVSPGVYEADIELGDVGIYSINLRKYEDGEFAASYNTAYANQYSKEYQFTDSTGALTSFIEQCGGTSITMEDTIWKDTTAKVKSRTSLTMFFLILSVILWMMDIVLRRLSIDLIAAAGRAGQIIAHGFVRILSPVAALPGKIHSRRKAHGTQNTNSIKASQESENVTPEMSAVASSEPAASAKKQRKQSKKQNASDAMLDMEELLKKKRDRE